MSVEVSYDREKVARNLARYKSGAHDIQTWKLTVIFDRRLEGTEAYLGYYEMHQVRRLLSVLS